MKAKGFIGIAAVLFVLLCAGCGAKQIQVQTPDTTSAEQVQTMQDRSEETAQAAEPAPAQTDAAQIERPTAESAGTTAPAGDDPVSAAAQDGTKADPQQTTQKAVGASASVPQLKTPASGTAAVQKSEDKPASGKASATSVSGKATTVENVGGGNAGTPASSSGETTKKDDSASTTKYVYEDAKGNAVQAKVTYLNDTPNYVSTLDADVLERFGIVGDKQKEVLKKPADWAAYTIELEFVNNESVPVTLYFLDVTDNGKNDVFINGDFSTEISLLPGRRMSELFYVLAKKSDSDGAVLSKIHRMAMRVQYAATPPDENTLPNFVYSDVG